MSEIVTYPNKGALKKQIGELTVYLTRTWDFTHGKTWFCQIYNNTNFFVGGGFHKTNRFTAFRKAQKDLLNYRNSLARI